jgi:deferrochelatase/peroxidase EfeB
MSGAAVDYADVQGTILRGYRVDLARHFILSITDAAGAGAFIGGLVDGTGGLPRITTARRWTVKPECFVNVAFTAAGLTALGVTDAQLRTFDQAFQRGATNAASASAVGDVGDSAPKNWIGGLADGRKVHLVLSLWVACDPAVLEKVSATLRAAFAGCLTELSAHDATALPDNKVHFGYRDSISQPTVIGAPPRKHGGVPDDQPPVATGEFLLGYVNASGGTYSVTPLELSTNGSYAAFRISEQDVAAFDAFLTDYAAKEGLDVEAMAGKVCGRWRNGNPLELQPDDPGEPLPMSEINNFTYVGTTMADDDTLGIKCPIGSHLRRNNPRNAALIGGSTSVQHRIVRRNIPYGPIYDPAASPQPAVPRGLIGYFINASLTNQFEFVLAQWNETSSFVSSATNPNGSIDGNAVFNISGQDVFLGVNDPSSSSFTLAAIGAKGANNKTMTGFSRMVITRGGAYVFFPSITGLRYLSTLPAKQSATGAAPTP